MNSIQLKYFKLLLNGSGNPKINPNKNAQSIYKKLFNEINRYENLSCQYSQKKILGGNYGYNSFIDFDYNLNGKESIAQNLININNTLELMISPKTLDLLLTKNAAILNDKLMIPKACQTEFNLHTLNNNLCEKIVLYDKSLYNDVWILYKNGMEKLDNHQNKTIQTYLNCIEKKLEKNIPIENNEYEILLNIMDILKNNKSGGNSRVKSNAIKEDPLKEK